MEQELNTAGICITCNYKEECFSYENSRISGIPIFYCEEFKNLQGKSEVKGQTGTRHVKEAGEKVGDFLDSPIPKGICVNCDNAGSCRLAVFGDDVHFCEEHSFNLSNAKQVRLSDKIFPETSRLGVKNLIPGWDTCKD